MPNLKVYADQDAAPDGLPPSARSALRDVLVDGLGASAAACQVAIVAVQGLPDQPAANIELAVMPANGRSTDALAEIGDALRGIVAAHVPGRIAFRCTILDPERFLALK